MIVALNIATWRGFQSLARDTRAVFENGGEQFKRTVWGTILILFFWDRLPLDLFRLRGKATTAIVVLIRY